MNSELLFVIILLPNALTNVNKHSVTREWHELQKLELIYNQAWRDEGIF